MIGRLGRFWTLFGLALLAACSAEVGEIDFVALTRSESPHDALGCPVDLCTAKADLVTRPVGLSAPDLAAKVLRTLPAEPRTELVSQHSAAPEGAVALVLVQRSAVFRFPDTINVLVRPLDAQHAVIAIYSRSNYGYGDFGVNLTRIKTWLAALGVESYESN